MGGIATTIYCLRNFNKAKNGDLGRIPVAIVQSANSMSQATQGILNKVDDLGRWADIGNSTCEVAGKVSRLASKITNPLLVGAAGIRVLRDDDKESALVEEGIAMSGMFLAEDAYKITRNTLAKNMGENLKKGQKCLEEGVIADSLKKLAGKVPKGKQRAVLILAELGLVATSIISYNLCKKLGEKLTGRDKKEDIKEAETKITTQTDGVNMCAQNPFAVSDEELAAAQARAKIY